MKKNGFTLIELLAVIIVLSIVLVIAIPNLLGIINLATSNAFEIDAKTVLEQIRYEQMKDLNYDISTLNTSTIQNLNISNTNYADLQAGTIDNKLYIVIIGKNAWTGLKACGSNKIMKVVPISDTETCSTLPASNFIVSEGVNKPLIVTGMVPIKWLNGVETVTTAEDPDWYDYANKKWANAKTADGSYWVWIPRYAYQITSGYHTSTAGTINIKFLVETSNVTSDGSKVSVAPTYIGDSQTNYVIHPAFTFGDKNITGIWIAKFEPTASEGVATITGTCDASDNVSTKTIKIIPNVNSWRCITVGNGFDATLAMKTKTVIYGWNETEVNTHIMKNMEWGAVTYLSKSSFGKEIEEIWNNPNSNYITGCAGDSASAINTNGCNEYNTENGIKASTTGNITGIYDMAGGAWERMPAYINNGDANLMMNGNSIINAENKYKDIYVTGTEDTSEANYIANSNKYGDAMYETSFTYQGATSWYSDYSVMSYNTSPWIHRVGLYSDNTIAGPYSFSTAQGSASDKCSFRPVIMVGTGL